MPDYLLASSTSRNQLEHIHEYARLRGLRHVFNRLPPRESYPIDLVPSEFAFRDGRLSYLPRRIQLGVDPTCTVWAYLRLQNGSLTGGTEVKLYAETVSELYPIKNENIHEYPFIEPLNLFSTSESSWTSGKQFKYLIKYLFLELKLIDEVFSTTSNAFENICAALRKIQTYYELRADAQRSNTSFLSIMSRDELRRRSVQRERYGNSPSHHGHDPVNFPSSANGAMIADTRHPPTCSRKDANFDHDTTKKNEEYGTPYSSNTMRQISVQPRSPKKEGGEELLPIFTSAEITQLPNILKEVRTEDIGRIMTRIEADESEDEHLSKELEAAKEYLELRKRKRDQALDYLIENRTNDLKEYLKKRKN